MGAQAYASPLFNSKIEMGRGKLGGTKAKVRGKIGSEIYQVKRACDGQLVQHVYKAPESREYTNTVAQARARMIMGQIERMFHILPDVIRYAFKSIPNGSLSFQHFSKLNYQPLREDVQDHWETDTQFDWRPKYDLSAPAGIWRLTNGELQPFTYQRALFSQGINNDLEISWDAPNDNPTIGDLLAACGMQWGDKLMVLFYVKPVETGLPYIEQITCSVNPEYNANTPLMQTSIGDVFLHDSDWDILISYSSQLHEMSLTASGGRLSFTYQAACAAYIIIRETTSGTKFSTSNFEWLLKDKVGVYPRTTPNQAFVSWQTL